MAKVDIDNFTKKISAENFSFFNELGIIIKEYKDGDEDPLNGDDVDRLTEIVRAKLNLIEGNITQEEYEKMSF